jgi:glucose-1-phosphate thymidylyltransferase
MPVAGEGTRLRPHTFSRPKVLIDVAGKPMLSHILDRLVDLGIEEAVFIVGHMGDAVEEFIRAEYSFNATFVRQPERKGLGHAVYLAREHVRPGPVLVVLGDTLFRADLAPVLADNKSRIAVMETDDPQRFGIVELKGDDVVGIIEKPADPPSNLAVIGIYYFTDASVIFGCLEHIIENDIKTKGEYQLTDAMALMVERKEQLGVFLVDGWYDCGKKETLLQANRDLLELEAHPAERKDNKIVPPVAIHPDARLEGCTIGPFASIARGVKIMNSAVRDSIICEGSEILDSALEGSVIGRGCVVKGVKASLNIGDLCEAGIS